MEESRALFKAAAGAGVWRIIHFSVANASSASRLPYFRGKGSVEKILKGTGISHAIIRSTLVFGEGDLPLNNTAWGCGGFRCFPSSGMAITRFSPSVWGIWRVRWWQPVP